MNIHFEHPTLVTLTAPTCAGKSYLLEALVTELNFRRIVSTTDRAPRAGEVEGMHYFFISTAQSKLYEEQGLFAELVTFNGTRYGVTNAEMERKMIKGAPPPLVILEPMGVQIYREYCEAHGWDLFSVFVDTPEEVRISRLAKRTADDIQRVIQPTGADTAAIRKIVDVNNKRLQAVLTEERAWASTNQWDAVVDGTNLSRALSTLCNLIEARNRIMP